MRLPINSDLVHIVASVAAEASGPSYSVPALCRALVEDGNAVTLMSIGSRGHRMQDGYTLQEFQQEYSGVPVLRKLLFSRGLHSELLRRPKERLLLHVHGLWLMPNIYPARSAKRGALLVVAPRGMLGREALEFSRRRKQVMWYALQKRAINAACCLHATSEQECEEIRRCGLRQPIAVVPNGIDVPTVVLNPEHPVSRTVLYLGRIHPKKGLDRLINAWRQIEALRPDWTLRIVGPDESGYLNVLRYQALQLGVKRVSFGEPLFGESKREAYRAAEVFVLPTLNENFGMTVAEALAHGTPVICTKGAPWQGLETNRCGWWIEHGVDALAATLIRATSKDPDELIAMGNRGQEWMAREFSWKTLAGKMAEVYLWLSGDGTKPGFIHNG